MDSKSAAGGGVSLSGVIGIVFVILRLVGVIDWPWWIVLLPFYWWIALGAIILLVIGFIWLLAKIVYKT